MRKVLQVVALALVLTAPVTGCALFQKAPEAGTVAATVKIEADRALVTAHQVWEGASFTLQALANAGVLKGAAAATAQKYYNEATGFLKQADHYRDVGNSVLQNQFAQAAIAAVALATTQKGN